MLDLETPVIPAAAPQAEEPRPAHRDHNPLDNITPEKPRTHPVTYGALALAALAFLLSVVALSRGGGDGYRQVKIGTNDCVIGKQADADVLYCRTPNVP